MNSEEQQFFNTLNKKLWTARSNLDAAFKDSDIDYFLDDDAHDLIHEELEIQYYYTEKKVFWVRNDALEKSAKQRQSHASNSSESRLNNCRVSLFFG